MTRQVMTPGQGNFHSRLVNSEHRRRVDLWKLILILALAVAAWAVVVAAVLWLR
jgi:hypothetical protein